MGIQDKAKKAAATAAGVGLATSGLTSCIGDGSVDPPPEPFQCSTVDKGQSLRASGVMSADTLRVTVTNDAPGSWTTVQVRDVINASLAGIEPGPAGQPNVIFVNLVVPDSVTAGTFTLEGVLEGFFEGGRCNVVRTFSFAISDQGVTVTLLFRGRLPLFARERAEIVMLGRSGRVLELEARTSYAGRHGVEWTATDGTLEASEARARWELPEQPGFYQVEVALDFGEDGLAFDALAVEVV